MTPGVRRDLLIGGAVIAVGIALLAFACFGGDDGIVATGEAVGLVLHVPRQTCRAFRQLAFLGAHLKRFRLPFDSIIDIPQFRVGCCQVFDRCEMLPVREVAGTVGV